MEPMQPRSRHLLVEYHGCNRALLDDLKSIEALMTVAAKAAGVTIVASALRPFVPQGVSGVLIIEESHLSIHTWPEHGYASVDFYTCGDGQPERAHEALYAGLEATRAEILLVERGLCPESPDQPAMRVLRHHAEGEDLGATRPSDDAE
jgi:S-adenosylmethionine decarboxylase proenzyme